MVHGEFARCSKHSSRKQVDLGLDTIPWPGNANCSQGQTIAPKKQAPPHPTLRRATRLYLQRSRFDAPLRHLSKQPSSQRVSRQ